MPRKSRPEPVVEDPNLTPLMNLVLILIPLLLLSVVFLEISVINVTMPQKSLGPPNNSGEPPKRLQLMISKEGFWIIKGDRAMPTIPECVGRGAQVTICLKEPEAQEAVQRYNWLSLYNTLVQLKQEQHWNEHEQIELVAGADISFAIMVKAMDVTRFQRVAAGIEDAAKGSTFSNVEEFNDSSVVRVEGKDEETGETGLRPLGLFPLVVLGLPTTG